MYTLIDAELGYREEAIHVAAMREEVRKLRGAALKYAAVLHETYPNTQAAERAVAHLDYLTMVAGALEAAQEDANKVVDRAYPVAANPAAHDVRLWYARDGGEGWNKPRGCCA